MVSAGHPGFVFLAGLVTALATGLGTVPFVLFGDVGDRWNVVLWGLASGIMVAASLFGLVREGLAYEARWLLVPGVVAGVALVVVGHDVLLDVEVNPQQYTEADARKLVLILGVLTVHSFPEGVAVGVSFAELGLETAETVGVFGLTLPVLGVFMTVAISVHNVPEGVAVAIPLTDMGVSNPRKVWWAVFSSLPQPVGAVAAFSSVRLAREFLPLGFGFAAGAMVYLVATEFIPEALSLGRWLDRNGYPELLAGFATGVAAMVPLALVWPRARSRKGTHI